MKDLSFEVFWSVDDKEWVATCTQWRSLAVLHTDPAQAFAGLVQLIEEEIDEMAKMDAETGGES